MTHSLRLSLGPSVGMLFAIAAASACIALVNQIVPIPNVMMVYVIALLYSATHWGRWNAITASLLAFLCYDFLFVEPRYTFTISDPEEWLALAIFLAVAFVTSSLAERLSAARVPAVPIPSAAAPEPATTPRVRSRRLMRRLGYRRPAAAPLHYRASSGHVSLRRLVLATDGSERASRAEAFVSQLVPPGKPCEIELLYVYPHLPPRNYRPDPGRPWHLNRDRLAPYVANAADRIFEAAEARVRESLPESANVRFWRRLVSSDDVAGTIVHEADRSSAELIVLGGREHGLVGLLGAGICREVVRRTTRPVVLVP